MTSRRFYEIQLGREAREKTTDIEETTPHSIETERFITGVQPVTLEREPSDDRLSSAHVCQLRQDRDGGTVASIDGRDFENLCEN